MLKYMFHFFKVVCVQSYCFKVQDLFGQVGRYVEATRDIAPLEVIMEDEPAVYGPEHDTVPVCLECLERYDTGNSMCTVRRH